MFRNVKDGISDYKQTILYMKLLVDSRVKIYYATKHQ